MMKVTLVFVILLALGCTSHAPTGPTSTAAPIPTPSASQPSTQWGLRLVADPQSVAGTQSVAVTSIITDGVAPAPVHYRWTIPGRAEAFNEDHVVLTFGSPGSYLIRLDATDANGRTVSAQQVVSVEAQSTPPIPTAPVPVPTPTPVPSPPSVEYRITGTALQCSATYQNSTGGVDQRDVNVPFSYSWNGAKSGDPLSMSCRIESSEDTGSITIELYTNGTLIRSATASGFPHVAAVSASY